MDQQEEDNIIKKFVSKNLEMWKQQVDNDNCPAAEIRSFASLITKYISTYSSAEEMAKCLDQSEHNVRNILSRRLIPKKFAPKRKTLYHFGWFLTQVPKNWLNK